MPVCSRAEGVHSSMCGSEGGGWPFDYQVHCKVDDEEDLCTLAPSTFADCMALPLAESLYIFLPVFFPKKNNLQFYSESKA